MIDHWSLSFTISFQLIHKTILKLVRDSVQSSLSVLSIEKKLFSFFTVQIGEAIQKNPNFLQLRRLEAAREIAHIIAKSQSRVYLNSDVLLLNTVAE
jgi:hypothetical protein